jgi:hypothetical protein
VGAQTLRAAWLLAVDPREHIVSLGARQEPQIPRRTSCRRCRFGFKVFELLRSFFFPAAATHHVHTSPSPHTASPQHTKHDQRCDLAQPRQGVVHWGVQRRASGCASSQHTQCANQWPARTTSSGCWRSLSGLRVRSAAPRAPRRALPGRPAPPEPGTDSVRVPLVPCRHGHHPHRHRPTGQQQQQAQGGQQQRMGRRRRSGSVSPGLLLWGWPRRHQHGPRWPPLLLVPR